MAHNTYGLDMRGDGLWRARCACGWESTASPDVGAQAGRLDDHLRDTLRRPLRDRLYQQREEPAALRALDRNILLGAVALGMALFGGLAAWVDHDVDGV